MTGDPEDRKRARREIRNAQSISVKQKILKEFKCLLCKEVMNLPLTTPCAHNFCKPCLEGTFTGQAFMIERKRGGRTLRSRKNVMKCPKCLHEISDFLQNPQVNRELMDVIEKLQHDNKKHENVMELTTEEEVHATEESSEALSVNEENEMPSPLAEEETKLNKADADPTTEHKPKRKKIDDSPHGSSRIDAQEAVDEGNDSPSSPLHLQPVEEIETSHKLNDQKPRILEISE